MSTGMFNEKEQRPALLPLHTLFAMIMADSFMTWCNLLSTGISEGAVFSPCYNQVIWEWWYSADSSS